MNLTWTSADNEVLTIDNSDPDSNYRMQEITGLNSPPSSIVTQQAPFQDGATLSNVQLAPREVQIVIAVRADTQSDLESRLRGLSKIFSPVSLSRTANLGTLAVSMAYGTTYYLTCAADGIEPQNSNAPLIKFFTVFLKAYDPIFYSTEQSVAFVVDVTSQAVNDGDLAALPYIDIVGPSNSPKIENQTTGQWIKVTGNVASGYKLRFDHRFGKKKATYINLSTGAETDWFQYLDSGYIFFNLIADTNDFILTSDDDSGSGTLYFNKNYLAVM